MAKPRKPHQLALPPKEVAHFWRVWFREPCGIWTNGGLCRTYKDMQSAIAALKLRGMETKPEYLGRQIGTDNQRSRA